MKKTCKYFANVRQPIFDSTGKVTDSGGEMILGDCVRDRCEFWDLDNACCTEVTQAKATEKLAAIGEKILEKIEAWEKANPQT
jgi:hypothetical protein